MSNGASFPEKDAPAAPKRQARPPPSIGDVGREFRLDLRGDLRRTLQSLLLRTAHGDEHAHHRAVRAPAAYAVEDRVSLVHVLARDRAAAPLIPVDHQLPVFVVLDYVSVGLEGGRAV